jgi:hypothetical protein
VAAALIFGFFHLFLTIGPGMVLASNPYWRFPQGDIAINVLGAESFLRDTAWHFPLAVTPGLTNAGQPVSIVFTDSAPWIAILIKSLHANGISIMGMTAALAIVFQPAAFVLLLLALGVRRPETLAVGTVLGSLLPAWYMRLGMHIALASHWLIVLALALAVTAIRRGLSWGVIAGLSALGALAFGFHPYLFAMVGAIAVGALLSDVARSGLKEAPKAAAGAAIFLSSSALSWWLLASGPSGGVAGYGHYSMNLLSPVFPQRSGLAEMVTGHSGRIIDATSGQYEGFNYLGAGVLICLLIAAGCLFVKRPAIRHWRPAVPLLLMLFGLCVFALSNRIYFGHMLVGQVPLPRPMSAAFDSLRSSGRMFWPVAYLSLAWSMMMLDQMPNRKFAGGVLASILLFQVLDTSTLRRMLRESYEPRPAPALDLRQLRTVAALRFVPAYSCTDAEHDEDRHIALAVERNGGIVEEGPIARFDPATCSRAAVEHQLAAVPPSGSVLLTLSALPADITETARRSGKCTAIGRNLLCADRPRGGGQIAARRKVVEERLLPLFREGAALGLRLPRSPLQRPALAAADLLEWQTNPSLQELAAETAGLPERFVELYGEKAPAR